MPAAVRLYGAVLFAGVLALAMVFASGLRAEESRESTRSQITVHFTSPVWGSVRQQYVNARLLHSLLWEVARGLPGFAPCQLDGAYFEHYTDFIVVVTHPNLARRLECLRAVISYLQQGSINEADFLAVRQFEVQFQKNWLEPRARNWGRVEEAASQLAYLSIYQKQASAYGIFSARIAGFADTTFDDFDLWLRRLRDEKLISFQANHPLLRQLGLPVPDPTVVAPYSYIAPEEPRVPAGTLLFDGERFGVDALIMVVISYDTHSLQSKILDQLACNAHRPMNFVDDVTTSAISRISCDTVGSDAGPWFRLAITKSDAAGYPEFCRQARELVHVAEIDTIVRFSPEGSKGLYVLLPPKCKAED